MKFFVVEIATGDSKIAGKSIYEYDNKDSAIATFHKKLGTAMASALYSSDLVMVIDENGSVWKSEKWVAPVEEEASDITE